MPTRTYQPYAPAHVTQFPSLAARPVRWVPENVQTAQIDCTEGSRTETIMLTPNTPAAIRHHGCLAQMHGDHALAIDCFRKAIATWPTDAALRVRLGIALYEHGEVSEALTQLRRACELAPMSALTWYNLGKALQQHAQAEEALAALQRAVALEPTHIVARLTLARVQSSVGHAVAAVREFREVLRREPENAKAWFGLSNLNVVRFDAEDTKRVRRAFARKDMPIDAHILLGFTLGKALEYQGDYAHAFEIFQLANTTQRRRVKWNGVAARRRVEAIQRSFSADLPAPLDPTLGREVIQIVSIPRSGSTLVEQILASHHEVEGANEISDMPTIIDAESRQRNVPFPLWAPNATAQDWQRLGNEYLARTARWRESRSRITDKNLINWYTVGAALEMLPAASVVIVRRDPVETCLACYRQWFSTDSGFAYDLDEMADYCIDFLRLTRFWANKYPGRVFDLEYETLVAEPEPTIRRLLAFCGLAFDRKCLEFHKTSRAVLSAPSAAQVRLPIRRDTARTRLYGNKLDRLRQRLGEAGVA